MPRFMQDDANSGSYCMWLASSDSMSDQKCLVSSTVLHAPADPVISRLKTTTLHVVLCTSDKIGLWVSVSKPACTFHSRLV